MNRDATISDRTVAGERQITVGTPDGRILGPAPADPASSAAEIAENLLAADADESVVPPPGKAPAGVAPEQHA